MQAWLSQYDPGVPADLPTSSDGLYELLSAAVQRFPDTCAISYFGRELSYWRLKSLCDAFAAALHQRGIVRLALMLPNCPQFVIALLGAVRAGTVVVPVPPDAPDLLADAPCDAAVILDSSLQAVKAVRADLPLIVSSLRDYLPPPVKLVYPVKPAETEQYPLPEEPDVRFLPLVRHARPLPFPPVSGREPLFASFSSAALAAGACQLALWPGRVLKRGQERLLAGLPLHRPEAVVACLGLSLAAGATLQLTTRVRSEDILAAFPHGSASILVAPPGVFEELATRGAPPPPRRPVIRSLRWALSVPGALSTVHRRTFEETADCPLVQTLCLGDGSLVCATPLLRPDGGLLPLPGTEVRVVGDQGQDVAAGQVGHLVVRGPQLAVVDDWCVTSTPAVWSPSGVQVPEPALSGNKV